MYSLVNVVFSRGITVDVAILSDASYVRVWILREQGLYDVYICLNILDIESKFNNHYVLA